MPGIRLEEMNRRTDAADASAFGAPRDPTDAGTAARAKLVYRDLPLITIQNTWTVEQARGALYAHLIGQFNASAQLWESILGDDRVMATLGSRVAGLFGREARFKAADDSMAAKECEQAWIDWWPRLSGDSSMTELHSYGIGLGVAPGQLVWDTTRKVWGPYIRPWNARYTYYDFTIRRLVALSEDGNMPITPGDGKWVLHAPFGEYRGWIRGAIRALTEPWMLRHFAFRDMARFSEIHGIPTRVGKVPAVSEPEERAAFEAAIANLGSDTSMILPQGVDGPDGSGYEYGLVEAKDTAWEVFPGLVDRCDMSIILAILFQNLTTEVKGGSFAATDSHMDIRQSGLQFDDAAWQNTIYNQIARPFAYINFGDADLAPRTWRDVEPRDDLKGNAAQFQAFGTAIQALSTGGVEFTDSKQVQEFAAKAFGLNNLPDFTIKAPAPKASGGGGDGFFGK